MKVLENLFAGDNMSNPHYFIAIPLPEKLKDQLFRWQNSLKQSLYYKQWPHRDDLHITLKFLGALDDKDVEEIKEALIELTSFEPFYTSVNSVGTFGNKTRPRVVWAGVHLNQQLTMLQNRVDNLTEEMGFLKDPRHYKPHITLAKKWNGPGDNKLFNEIKKNLDDERYSLYVDKIVLYEIHPKNKPKYKAISNYCLGGTQHNGSTN